MFIYKFSARIKIGLVFFLASIEPLLAIEISVDQAKKAVANWAQRNPSPLESTIGQTVRDAQTYQDREGNTLCHVIRFEEGGFVVTSADDHITPIIAVSEDEDLVVDEHNPLWTLLNRDLPQRKLHVTTLQAQQQVRSPAVLVEPNVYAAQWAELLSDDQVTLLGLSSVSDVRVSPLLQSKWGQSIVSNYKTFNYYTPNNSVCGCLATAGAQIMRYHQYPTASVSAGTYLCFVNDVATSLTMQGGTYAWSSMPLVPSSSITLAQRQAIGKLTYDFGVAIYMQYTLNSSGAHSANLAKAFTDRFGYASARLMQDTSSVVAGHVQQAVLSNLDAGYPVSFGIRDVINNYGHEVVGDGYGYSGSTLYVHLNMGWYGTDDAWYNLPSVEAPSYSEISSIVYNIFPSHTGELLSGRVLNSTGDPVSGASVIAVDETTGTTLPAVTSNTKGIYAIQVPRPASPTTHAYRVNATSGSLAGTTTTTISASMSSETTYIEDTRHLTYYYNTGNVGNRWGVNLTMTTVSIPLAPTYVCADDGTSMSNVALSWKASTDATAYDVFRYTSNSSASASKVGSSTGTNYTDSAATPGTLYYYWVKARNVAGSSGFSSSDSGFRALSAPTGVSATDMANDAVTVTWRAVTGASYYRVYRSDSSTGTKTALGGWQSELAYSDATTSLGTTYYYWVSAAVDSSGTRCSVYSSWDTGLRTFPVALGVALDNTSLQWTMFGSGIWFGQSADAHDGVDTAQSQGLGDSQTNGFLTTVTGPGTLSFWWKVSSEKSYDYLTFYIDGVRKVAISGTPDWMQQTANVAAGTHILKWAYSKDGATVFGSDCGWVDQVLWMPSGVTSAPKLTVPGGGIVGESGNKAFVQSGEERKIFANKVSGKMFQKWTVSPSSAVLGASFSPYLEETRVIMPAASVTLTPIYVTAYGFVTVHVTGNLSNQELSGILWSVNNVTWMPVNDDQTYPLNIGSYTVSFRSGNTHWQAPLKQTIKVVQNQMLDLVAVATYIPCVSWQLSEESASGSGTVTLSPTSGLVLPNKPVTLTAKPATGFVFVGWENLLEGPAGIERSSLLKVAPVLDTVYKARFRPKDDCEIPEITIDFPSSGMVGVEYSALVGMNDMALPVKFSADVLPSGLKIDASTGAISGVPTRAGTFTTTFSASNAKGSALHSSFTFSIDPLPIWAQGSFSGYVDTDEMGLGSALMSVSALGTISGKLSTRNTNFTFSAVSYTGRDENGHILLTTKAKADKTVIPLALEMYHPDESDGAASAPKTLGRGRGILGADGGGYLSLYRTVWKDTGMIEIATNYTGYYTATIPGDGTYGSGFLTFTVDKLGNVKTTGKLADGTAISLSGPLLLENDGSIFAIVYTSPTAYKGGYFYGWAEFAKDDGGAIVVRSWSNDPLHWMNLNPQATGEYGAGFNRTPGLVGGWYDKLINLRIFYEDGLTVGGVTLPLLTATCRCTDWNATETIKVTSMETYKSRADSSATPNGLVLGVTPASGTGSGLIAPRADTPVKDLVSGVYDYTTDTTGDGVFNASGLTFTFVRATGLFKGSFKTWYDYLSAEDYTTDEYTYAHTSATVPFEGVLTPVRETGDEVGRGFFLWKDISSSVSGKVETLGNPIMTPYSFTWSYDFLLFGY